MFYNKLRITMIRSNSDAQFLVFSYKSNIDRSIQMEITRLLRQHSTLKDLRRNCLKREAKSRKFNLSLFPDESSKTHLITGRFWLAFHVLAKQNNFKNSILMLLTCQSNSCLFVLICNIKRPCTNKIRYSCTNYHFKYLQFSC